MGSKSDYTSDEWRARFPRSYESDQCYPVAVHAALVSSDHIFGSTTTDGRGVKEVSRRMGYRRYLASTPADAMQSRPFRQFLKTHGLEYANETSHNDPVGMLRRLARSDESSFPLVSVHLGFMHDHRGLSLKGVDTERNSHVVAVLRVTNDSVEFFDGTFHPERMPRTPEEMSLARFLKHWEADPYQPLFVEYIRKRQEPRAGLKRPTGKALEEYKLIGGEANAFGP